MTDKHANPDKLVALTVDIEDWYHLPPITGAPGSKYKDVPSFMAEWQSDYDFLSAPTLKTLEMLDSLKLKATFFIVADVVTYYPGLVEKIATRGHEIACHGLHHACKIDPGSKKPLMTAAEFKTRTLEAKNILEETSNQKIIGYRAPNAYIAGWMLDILEELGFRYDSSVSVNSLYNKTDSRLTGVDTRLYYPKQGHLDWQATPRNIVEIPWPYFQSGIKFPTAGGPLLRLLGSQYIKTGLKASLKRSSTVFYFHPLDMCELTFPLQPSLINKLFWMVKGETVAKRLGNILTDSHFQFVTCQELVQDFYQTR